jgi:putative isomerase
MPHPRLWLLVGSLLFLSVRLFAESAAVPTREIDVIRSHVLEGYSGMFREEGGAFKYPFLTPGSTQYPDVLWDWDSWLSDVALRQVLQEKADPAEKVRALRYEQGCVLNYLSYGGFDGWVPIILQRNSPSRKELLAQTDSYATNMHKPCLAQHAAFLTKLNGGDAEWLREGFFHLQAFVNRYKNHQRHKATGLYFWNDDTAIGVDNDPATYMRPPKSSGPIYLNCLMYRELLAMVYLCERLGQREIGVLYQRDADELKAAVQKHCWDERDGFFYSVDLNLLPYEGHPFAADPSIRLHSGYPRDYDCLIQRLDVWSGFLPLWAEIATPEQARRMVERLKDERTFNAPYGIRTLSALEKMYNVRASGNPSLWTGPIWGVSNYLVWRGLVKYGYKAEATDLADKTIRLFARDFERFGALHEYYLPESGEPVLNRGFQNWNYLVLNMVAWRQGGDPVAEF